MQPKGAWGRRKVSPETFRGPCSVRKPKRGHLSDRQNVDGIKMCRASINCRAAGCATAVGVVFLYYLFGQKRHTQLDRLYLYKAQKASVFYILTQKWCKDFEKCLGTFWYWLKGWNAFTQRLKVKRAQRNTSCIDVQGLTLTECLMCVSDN